MKIFIALSAVLLTATFSAAAHADEPMSCTYQPNAPGETLALNADTLYVDIESPKNSFMLLGKDTDNLIQEAQQMIIERKIVSGTMYAFERFDEGNTKLSVTISPIVNSQFTDNSAKVLDFATVEATTLPGHAFVLQAAPGVSCQLGNPIPLPVPVKMPVKKASPKLSKMGRATVAGQCYVDSDCLPSEVCQAGQCTAGAIQ